MIYSDLYFYFAAILRPFGKNFLRFDDIFDQIGTTFDQFDNIFDQFDTNFDQFDDAFDQFDGIFDQIGTPFDQFERMLISPGISLKLIEYRHGELIKEASPLDGSLFQGGLFVIPKPQTVGHLTIMTEDLGNCPSHQSPVTNH